MQTLLSKEYAGNRWRGGATGKAFGLAINNANCAFQRVGRPYLKILTDGSSEKDELDKGL